MDIRNREQLIENWPGVCQWGSQRGRVSDWCGTAGALPELAGVALIARAAQFSGAEAWGLRCGEGQPGLPLYIICSRREAEDTLLEFGVEHSGLTLINHLFRCKHKVAQLTHK